MALRRAPAFRHNSISLWRRAHALLDIDDLLGRHGEKDDLAGELFGGIGIAHPIAARSRPAILGIVGRSCGAAAGVGSASGCSEVAYFGSHRSRARPGPGAWSGEPSLTRLLRALCAFQPHRHALRH